LAAAIHDDVLAQVASFFVGTAKEKHWKAFGCKSK
jgi:hypothetical protein